MIKKYQEKIISLELPYQEETSLERTVFDSGGPGPKVAILSGIHGDELEGLYVCHRLATWLDANPKVLKGRVELYPALNPLGLDTLQRLLPIYEVDLNRNFPGSSEGNFPQRMAAAIMKSLEGAKLVLDIHASNIYLREIPQVRINEEFAETLVPIARQMNLDVIWLHGSMTVLETTVAHSLNAQKIPCLVVEMGVGMRVTPAFTDQLVAGILNAWKNLGVIASEAVLPAVSHTPMIADGNNVHYLNAEISGLFIPTVEHWTSVTKGQLLGRIVSPFDSDTLSEVRSPVDGVLFTLREYPLVYEGSLMARLMEVKK